MNTLRLVINLPARIDRKSEMQSQLRSVGWDAEFFSAYRPDNKGKFPSIGALGCFLSHLGALNEAISRGYDRLVLMEDDLNFVHDFPQRWRRIEEFLNNSNCNLMYPAHTLRDTQFGITRLEHNTSFICSHFIVFDRVGMLSCAEQLEIFASRHGGHPLGGPMHVDGAYATIREQNPGLLTFAHYPSLGYQRPSRTDVNEGHWLDRLPVLGALARKAKSILLPLQP